MYGGLITAITLIVFSPAVSGAETAMLGAGIDFAWFPLTNPAIISVPAGFLLGIIGSKLGKPDDFSQLAAEMEVRSLTGVGMAKAISH